jgi:hypothetical protein
LSTNFHPGGGHIKNFYEQIFVEARPHQSKRFHGGQHRLAARIAAAASSKSTKMPLERKQARRILCWSNLRMLSPWFGFGAQAKPSGFSMSGGFAVSGVGA